MLYILWATFALVLRARADGVGEAWDVSPGPASVNADPPSWPRLESAVSKSALDVRSISGVGRLAIAENPQEVDDIRRSRREIEDFEYDEEELIEGPRFDDFQRNRRGLEDVEIFDQGYAENYDERSKRNVIRVLDPTMHHFTQPHVGHMRSPRSRRDAEPKMEQIAGTKSVREARLNSPESWSKQPFSVEFRHHANLDQIPGDKKQGSVGRQAPRIDFVTGHRRDYGDGRESRAMSDGIRGYDDYVPMYHDKIREREFDVPIPRGYYPDRYRSERDYYVRRPSESPYYYNRYHEEDLNPYGRAYTPRSQKPKRVIYYARLPEISRTPVDLRNYRYPYDDVIRSPAVAVASSTSYSRAPGNADPSGYRYRSYPYEASRPRTRDPYKRPYSGYQSRTEEEGPRDRAALKESPEGQGIQRMEDGTANKEYDAQMSDDQRSMTIMTWPVQVGAGVSVGEEQRNPGRNIYGQVDDYDRYQKIGNLQNAPESSDGEKNKN